MVKETASCLTPKGDLIILNSAGPNIRPAVTGCAQDALAFFHNPHVLSALEVVCSYTGLSLYRTLQSEISKITSMPSKDGNQSFLESIVALGKPELGKLSRKFEAAGKVRIFAITDIWTQSALKPLHDFLFEKVLRGIKEDGTFDQAAPLRELLERKGPNAFIASYDLSAATDRLPIDLQVQILGKFISLEFASA